MARRFEGKTAFVTGGASGLGAATATALCREGALVVVADCDFDAASALVAKMGEDRAHAVACDVTQAEEVTAAVRASVDRFGQLDLAVNNAGISPPSATIADLAEQDWRRVIDIDLTSVFLCLREEIKAMRTTGGGAIVNMASALGLIGAARGSPYVAAKHGVIGLTKSAALECAGDNIRVNAVAPGLIQTPLIERALSEEKKEAMRALHPLGRLGDADEIAGLVLFLLSDEASFITGSTHLADGGWTAW